MGPRPGYLNIRRNGPEYSKGRIKTFLHALFLSHRLHDRLSCDAGSKFCHLSS